MSQIPQVCDSREQIDQCDVWIPSQRTLPFPAWSGVGMFCSLCSGVLPSVKSGVKSGVGILSTENWWRLMLTTQQIIAVFWLDCTPTLDYDLLWQFLSLIDDQSLPIWNQVYKVTPRISNIHPSNYGASQPLLKLIYRNLVWDILQAGRGGEPTKWPLAESGDCLDGFDLYLCWRKDLTWWWWQSSFSLNQQRHCFTSCWRDWQVKRQTSRRSWL